MGVGGACATGPLLWSTALANSTQLHVPQHRIKNRRSSCSTVLLHAVAIVNYEPTGRQWRCKAAPQQDLPQELLEDSKFERIKDEDPNFGPPALLLLGFGHDEVMKVKEFLKETDGEFLRVHLCTKEMINGTLWEAINSTQEDLLGVQVLEGLPRICFLSGLTGKEIMYFVETFSEIGLESTVFAALVPKNAGKILQDLIEEIMDDHNRLSGISRQ